MGKLFFFFKFADLIFFTLTFGIDFFGLVLNLENRLFPMNVFYNTTPRVAEFMYFPCCRELAEPGLRTAAFQL